MRATDLDFHLPPERIATTPVTPRDTAKLLICSRSDPDLVTNARVHDLPDHLRPNDTLVFNRSSVLPARLHAQREDTAGRVEGLFITADNHRWTLLLKSNGKLRPGTRLTLLQPPTDAATATVPSPHTLTLVERAADAWTAELATNDTPTPDTPTSLAILQELGSTPLPPYIRAARHQQRLDVPDHEDRDRYQTVYADPDAPGSVAAPTAGLHFTPQLLDALKRRSVQLEHVLLHVGPGTFKPVEDDTHLQDHTMHEELTHVPAGALNRIDAVAPPARRVLVGTTTVRTLESIPRPLDPHTRANGHAAPTSLFITPGFQFRWTDALLTNFHQPRSTLIALVAAFLHTPHAPGIQRLHTLYKTAIDRRYRFLSYGDAMLILP